MAKKAKPKEDLEDTLAEGIAAAMAAEEEAGGPEPEQSDLTFLYLDELNRIWSEPASDQSP